MATLSELEDDLGEVARYDPELAAGAQFERLIFVTRQFQAWVEKELSNVQSQWTVETSPAEQLATMFDEFCAGEELEYGTGFHVLHPSEKSVWELKTPDLRVFGWFYRRDCFIAHRIDAAERVKRYNLYAGYVGEVARYRDQLPLDEPKLVAGKDPYDVVSNYAYP